MKPDFNQSCLSRYFPGTALIIFVLEISFFLFFFYFSIASSSPAAEIAPARTITVVAESPDVPEWKKIWDDARSKVKAGNYSRAVLLYEQLHSLKPNIEEANWEFFKVLVKNDQTDSAAQIINTLLEKNPSKIEYLLGAGSILLSEKNYHSAVKQFGRVLEFDPDGKYSVQALKGMISGLEGEKKQSMMLPLLEQLHLRDKKDIRTIHKLIRTAGILGKTARVEQYFEFLLQEKPLKAIDIKILFFVINQLEKTDDIKKVAGLWQEYLRRRPHYLPYHKKLADYYLSTGKKTKALSHLIRQLEEGEYDDSLLKLVAEIYLHSAGRPDKALSYFEKYLKKHPEDKEIIKNIKNIQSILADDFLAIVENDGAWLLWRDLAQLTPNRLAIYREMAALLEKKGKIDELFEILKIIQHHDPKDKQTLFKIISICQKKSNYSLALKYLQKIPAEYKNTKKYFLLKGDLEYLAGNEISSLQAYSEGLKKDTEDLKLRQTCIRLAGRLGLIDRVIELFSAVRFSENDARSFEFIMNYMEQLEYNSFFSRLDSALKKYTTLFENNKRLLLKLQLLQAKSFRKRGNLQKEEALLRSVIAKEGGVPEVLFRLSVNYIKDKNIAGAEIWKNALALSFSDSGREPEKNSYSRQCNYLEGMINIVEGETSNVFSSIAILASLRHKQKKRITITSEEYKLKKELCWLLLESGDIKPASIQFEKLLEAREFDPDRIVLKHIFTKYPEIRKQKTPEYDRLYIGKQPIVSKMLQVAGASLRHNEFAFGLELLRTVLENVPASIRGKYLLAEYLYYSGKMSRCRDVYREIFTDYPNEKHFLKRLVISEGKLERYQEGLSVLVDRNKTLHELPLNESFSSFSADFEETLLYARMLWGSGKREKSLEIYEWLLNPPVVDLLEKRFEFEEIYYLYLTKEKSFWNSLKYLLQTKPEIVAELMKPSFLIDNMGNETGRIVSDYYSLYRWQNLIESEYKARKAIVKRDYETAERNYKRMLEDAEVPEGLYELASIYDRLGQYRKEAQVYAAIRSSGTTSSRLESSIESNSMKISPHTGVSAVLISKEGRNGYMNLEKRGFGISLMFTPDLQKDIKFEFSRNIYEEITGTGFLTSSFLESTGTLELTGDTDFRFSGSAERLSDDAETRFYYSIGLHSQLDDYFKGFMEGYKKKVNDTLLAVKNGLYNEGFEIGLAAETPVGMTVGGAYRHRYYSDGNSQNRFHGWSSYNIYGESTHWALQYDYQFLKNSSSNENDDSDLQERGEEKTYWKPGTFDEHKITAHFQHLISGDYGSDKLLSYYSFDNSIGYEDRKNIIYTGKFDIFLEMSHHFLLKGNFIFEKSDDYEEKTVQFSLFYRW
jgi:thioredoxin-like negative regulator of GroEL